MSVHPDKTAIRAVDACGGTYTTAQIKSEYAEGHTAAICEAMKAVVDADALTAELLAALSLLLSHDEQDAGCLPTDAHRDTQEYARAAIAKATGADQ